ncbi:formimidoylglutamase [Fangia hongkongensis]|uniref:formimidoylglutamase n=1 Tax=Fangia hongkongensis TaxID=270495 RepID=UPI00036BE168|nr:formimidoylglutamase [Fangia hongkongensis]MBK2125381.1 formimidoylglutamase [Fangia hongkongensis]
MYLALEATPKEFRQRVESSDALYFYHLAKPINLDHCLSLPESSKPTYTMLGFCCDEGVRRNQGIIGAKNGPKAFREAFYNLPYHLNNFALFDAGDVICQEQDLEDAQKTLAEYVKRILDLGAIPIVIGGGHETAWGHLQGIYQSGYFPTIYNFDAHFDLRQTTDNKGSSGTPFYQACEYLKSLNKPFEYNCFGIQNFANTRTLFDFADANGVNYQLAEEINLASSNTDYIETCLRSQKDSSLYLSICLDVFNASIAPGVSSQQPLGIYPEYVIQSMKKIKEINPAMALDIVELNPLKDKNNLTAKLAASLIAVYLHA